MPAIAILASLIAPVVAPPAPAETLTLTLEGHRFTPQAVSAPAGRRLRIVLINKDAASEEFDSTDLEVEADVTPNGRTSFEVGPLKPGRYEFMGEHHAKTAQGVLTVTPGS